MSVKQRLHRPTGIRNGGLLLALTALALVMTLVDAPVEPGRGPGPPGAFQFLPPPIGIAQLPPVAGTPVWPGAGYTVIRLVASFQVAAISSTSAA